MSTKNYRYIGISASRSLIALITLLAYNEAFAQIYTPQGSYVSTINRGEQLTTAQKEALKQEWKRTYPRAIYWGEATTTYNCHAYAWSVIEGGEKCWMNTPNDDIYMTDGSYTSTYRSDPKARKVSYGKDDHSAIIPSYGGNYLISKWGSGCLMKHLYNDCPYNSTDLMYYKLSMEISGDKIIALPSTTTSVTKTYTLSNVPNGASIEWKVVGGRAVISAQEKNSIQVQIPGTGNYSVYAKVHCKTGLVVNVPSDMHITVSAAPIITDVEMFKYCQASGEFTLRVISNQPEGSFTWSVLGGKSQLYEIPYPDDALFLQYPNSYKAVHFYEKGIYTITVVGSKVGTTDTNSFSKDFKIEEVVSEYH